MASDWRAKPRRVGRHRDHIHDYNRDKEGDWAGAILASSTRCLILHECGRSHAGSDSLGGVLIDLPCLLGAKQARPSPPGRGWRVPRPRFAACGLDRLSPARQVLLKQVRHIGSGALPFQGVIVGRVCFVRALILVRKAVTAACKYLYATKRRLEFPTSVPRFLVVFIRWILTRERRNGCRRRTEGALSGQR